MTMIQLTGILHQGSAPLRTAMGKIIMLLVRRSRPWRTIMTRPTGKRKPPRTLTIPGLEVVNEGEPPVIIRSKRPPNESMTPARTALKNVLS